MPGIARNTLKTSDALLPLPERGLAARWGKSVRTLQRWRAEGYGPAYLRIGGTIHYRMADVLAFEQAVRRGGDAGE